MNAIVWKMDDTPINKIILFIYKQIAHNNYPTK